MRVFQIVGVRKSGKTSTVELLIGQLRTRGFRVGTVKSINCPVFSIDQRKDSNTGRHRKAGAEIVVAAGKNETDFLFSHSLSIDRILKYLALEELDFVIVEGGYQYNLPRIVCLKNTDELEARRTDKTFAVSGMISNFMRKIEDLDVINAFEEPEKLVKLIMTEVPEVSFPIELLPRPECCRNYCGRCSEKGTGGTC